MLHVVPCSIHDRSVRQLGIVSGATCLSSSVRYWLCKQRRQDPQELRLVRVSVTGTACGCFEARVADVGLRFEVGTDPEYVVRLLRALGRSC